MSILVNLSGRLVPPEQALVPVLDRGFLYGDSVYEVARTYGGAPFALAEHLDRLEGSAARIGLRLPPRAQIQSEIARTLQAAGNAESYLRVMVTRGEGSHFGLAPSPASDARDDGPRLIILVRPLELPPPELYARGLHLALVRVRRNDPRTVDPKAKTGNYLNSVLAIQEARASGADDAIFLDLKDRVTESSSANLFFVKDGVVVTPPLTLGLLAGITRAKVIEAARAAGILVREEPHGAGALAEADEVFLTSTLREVMPVTQLSLLEDRDPAPRPVGNGAPGPMAARLLQLFRERAAAAGLAAGAGAL